MPFDLKSHAVPSALFDEVDDLSEHHTDDICSIKVTQKPGFLCTIDATATIDLPSLVLFRECLAHPDNAEIFRHMDRCTYRKVLGLGNEAVRQFNEFKSKMEEHSVEESPATTGFVTASMNPSIARSNSIRLVKVAHQASWRFLWMHGTFTTALHVLEDHDNLSMHFYLLPEESKNSIINRFQGSWAVEEHPLQPSKSSVSTLRQDIGIRYWVPPPLDRLFKRVCCGQVKRIFWDVLEEAKKINKGKGTLASKPYQAAKDKEIVISTPAAD